MKLYPLLILVFLATAVSAYGEGLPIPVQANIPPEKGGTVTGQVMIRDKTPMGNGKVLLFDKSLGAPPHPYKYWRIPDLIFDADAQGRFSFEVAAGTYYMMVAQKKPDSEIGPPKENEYIYFHGDSVENPKPLIVVSGKRLDLGALTNTFEWLPGKLERDKGITAVEGVVVDVDGKPVERAIVIAYLSKITTGRPVFVSDRTDNKGNYLLRLSEGGTYYLKVRSIVGGGAPEPGEPQSTTKQFESVNVTLTKGQRLKGVTLKVDRFTGRGSAGTLKPDMIWKNTEILQGK